MPSGNADWKNGNLGTLIGLPSDLSSVASSVSSVVTPIQTVLQTVSTVLSVAKTFLIGGNNPLSSVVNGLLTQIQNLINNLDQAGIYVLLDYPLPAHETHQSFYGQNLLGGMPGFANRVVSAFVNPMDGNRPTFTAGASLTGVAAIFNSGDIGELVQALGSVAAFFGNTFKPSMNPPFNVHARPVNNNFFTKYIDPITDNFIPSTLPANTATWVTDSIGNQHSKIVLDQNLNVLLQEPAPDSIAISWRNQPSFLPTSFVVERSQVRGGVPSLQVNSSTGKAMLPTVSTQLVNMAKSDGSSVSTTEVTVDNTGKKVTYYTDFRNSQGVPNANSIVNFSSGLTTGYFTFIDTQVTPGIPYYYRVRAKFGSASSGAFIDLTQAPWTTLNSISPGLIGILNTINQFRLGEGEPSEEVMGFVPTAAELASMVTVAQNTPEGIRPFSTTNITGDKWVKFSLSNWNLSNVILKNISGFVNSLNLGITSTVQDIVNFITLLQTKIDAINQVISLIEAIAQILSAFSLPGFSFLAIPSATDTSDFLGQLSDASNPPPTSPEDYVGGVVMLAGGPGSQAIVTAFSLLTGAISAL